MKNHFLTILLLYLFWLFGPMLHAQVDVVDPPTSEDFTPGTPDVVGGTDSGVGTVTPSNPDIVNGGGVGGYTF